MFKKGNKVSKKRKVSKITVWGCRPLKAIRLHCIDCSGWQLNEVRLCAHKHCALWHLRSGRQPANTGYKDITVGQHRHRIDKNF